GVDAVRPGSVVCIDLDDLATSERRWYRIEEVPAAELAGEYRGLGRPALLEAVEARLRESVRRRLMSDVPLGTMCSGGLDSSLITALAAHESATPLHAFNAALV